MNSKITIITTFFYPEDTAIGLYTTQFAEFLSKKGYEITVLTGFPNYPQWEIHPDYKTQPKFYTEIFKDIRIIRSKQFVPKKVTFFSRIRMMFSLLTGVFSNLKKVKDSDLVICVTPFTLLAWPAKLLAKKNNAKLWIHVQDLEFDLAFESGILKKNNIIVQLLKKYILLVEKNLFISADVVSSISHSMIKKIKSKTGLDNTYLFSNWVSAEKINPANTNQHALIKREKFTLLYSGNIGEKQDWQFFESFCEVVKDDNIEIVIVGDGGYSKKLKQIIAPYSFVKMYQPVPFNELSDLLCSVDAHFLFQKIEVVDTIMPSKLLGMMASGKPSIISGNKNSEVAEIIKDSKGGWYFSDQCPEKVYNQVLWLKANKVKAIEIGESARQYILSKFDEGSVLEKFLTKIKSTL